jgi:hypothetical protein
MPPGKPVERKETLARFSVFGSWTRSDGMPKVDLFMPDHSLTVSVFRIDGLSNVQLASINNAVDMARRNKLVNYGYCPVNAGKVTDNGFTLDPNDEPKHHVNIMGFGPAAAAHRAKALLLAQIAGKLTDAHLK